MKTESEPAVAKTDAEQGAAGQSVFPLFQRGEMLRDEDGVQYAVTEAPTARNGGIYSYRSYGLDDDHLIHELPQHKMEDGRFISENDQADRS